MKKFLMLMCLLFLWITIALNPSLADSEVSPPDMKVSGEVKLTSDAQPPKNSDAGTSKKSENAKPDEAKKEVVGQTPNPIQIYTSFKEGLYREGIAGCIVLLIFIWRRFVSQLVIGKLSPWWIGFVTVLLGYLGSIPAALQATPFEWGPFIWHGLIVSAEAMLCWQMLGKKLLPSLFGRLE